MASLIEFNHDRVVTSNLMSSYHKANNLNIFPQSQETLTMTEFTFERDTCPKSVKSETIHSGHFMVSEIDENGPLSDKTSKEVLNNSQYVKEEEDHVQVLLDYSENKNSTQTYIYGSKLNNCVSIDGSLTKLFQCMTLAYNDGKITSPKWKTFKGLKLNIKDKIRLNNIIWRAWHIQYIAGRHPAVCQFSSPIDSDRHKRTETILLEGKYWKRRVDVVKAEYKKWRIYYQHLGRDRLISRPSSFDWENNLPRWSNNLSFDSLFSYTDYVDSGQPSYNNVPNSCSNFYDFTNSREIARSGMGAEFMQPGLEQLQPNIDFMDTFEPIQEFITRVQTLPTVQEEPANYQSQALKEQESQEDLLNSIFATGGDNTNASIEEELTKPMMSTTDYSSQSLFQHRNEMILNSSKIDSTNSLVGRTQSSSSQSFNDMSKMNNFNFSPTNNTFNDGRTLQENQLAQQNISIDNLYKMEYSNTNSLVSINDNVNSGCENYMQRFQQPKINQQFSSQRENSFSTESNLYYEQSAANKTPKNNKYNKFIYSEYFPTQAQSNCDKQFVDVNVSGNNSSQKNPNGSRSRSRSISMAQVNNKSSTIKNLLNKPSLVSTLQQNDLFTTSDFLSQNTSQMLTRANIERSLSLPSYGQHRQKRSDLSNSMILQGLQSPLAATCSNNEYETTPKSQSYSFNSNANGFYQNSMVSGITSTSPVSNNSSDNSYSVQDSQQCLPLVCSNNSSSQITKMGSHVIDDFCSNKVSNSVNDSDPFITNRNKNIITNIRSNSNPLFIHNSYSSRANVSSSSSSPISSLESSSNLNASGNMDSSTLIGLANSPEQTHFNMLNKSSKNLFPTDFSKESIEQKRSLEKSELHSMKNKILSESISTPFPISSDFQQRSSQLSREIAFKHLNSSPHLNLSISSNFGSIGSSFKPEDRTLYKERRRVCHINAEQKRRCNIKNGFDTLRNLLPSLNSISNTKISKAAMLHKAADYIRILKTEKFEQQKEYDMLKQQVDGLNQTISVFQDQLPATGAPVMGQRSGKIKEHYVEYVQSKTLQNWKFWIFSIIMESLLDSYCNTVATSNFEEMCKTLFRWLDQSCCLITLRRDILNSLRYISTSTNILNSPESLPEEVLMAVANAKQGQSDSSI